MMNPKATWRFTSIVLLGLATAASATPPPSSILLFWASWCAPCRAEVADLVAIERAAAPMRVLVVPVERSRASRQLLRDLPERNLFLPPEGGLALMQQLTNRAASLPVAVAIDAQGHVCAVQYHGVNRADAENMARRCNT